MNRNFPQKKLSSLLTVMTFFCFFLNISFANPDTIFTTIPNGQFGSSCVDVNSYPGTIQTINNFCPTLSGDFANFSIPADASLGCINYFGLEVGSSEGCFEICDDQSNCDTVHILSLIHI